jgi:hypothetical protein
MSPLEQLQWMPALNVALVPSREVVYFARSGDLVKIGQTRNVAERIKQLRLMSAAPIDLVAFGLGDKLRELLVHAELDNSHHHGEWFAPSLRMFELMRWASVNSAEWRAIGRNQHVILTRSLEVKARELRNARRRTARRTQEAA